MPYNNIEKNREYNREYYRKRKEQIIEQKKQYYHDNKDKLTSYSREYYSEHKDKYSEYRKKYKEWYDKTPMGRASHLLSSYNRSDKKYGRGKGNLTSKWIVENIFSKPCAHCGKVGWQIIGCNRLDNSKPHTMDNVEPCCKECNNIEQHKI